MASARREDLKAIWEVVNCEVGGWEVWLDDDRSELFEDWNEFEKFLRAEEGVEKNEEEKGMIMKMPGKFEEEGSKTGREDRQNHRYQRKTTHIGRNVQNLKKLPDMHIIAHHNVKSS